MALIEPYDRAIGFYGIIEIAEIDSAALRFGARSPAFFWLEIVDAWKARRAPSIWGAIKTIDRVPYKSQISPTVIELIGIPVIDLVSVRSLQNKTVHCDAGETCPRITVLIFVPPITSDNSSVTGIDERSLAIAQVNLGNISTKRNRLSRIAESMAPLRSLHAGTGRVTSSA
jgi:hypothetical protein